MRPALDVEAVLPSGKATLRLEHGQEIITGRDGAFVLIEILLDPPALRPGQI